MYLLTSNTESCDDDGEVGEGAVKEELADKTKNHKWYIVRCIAINSLALFGEMWFLTADPVVGFPMIFRVSPTKKLREFLQEAKL